MEPSDKNVQIFNALSALVQDPKFGDSQYAFYEKNAEQFEDDVEENKLEHTNIHQEYVYILDNIMESTLKQTYSDDEINNFYVDFATDMKKYESLNSHTMDQLYTFIDFMEFKRNIIGYKKGPMAIKAEELKAQDEKYRKILQSMTEDALGKYYELEKEDVNDPKYQWTKTAELKNDVIQITVHKRPLEGSSLCITRADVMMKNVNVQHMRKFAFNYEQYAKRIDKKNMMKYFKYIVNNDPEGYFLFMTRSKIGPMATDRDSLVEMRIQDVEPGKSIFLGCQSVEREDIPHADDAVRMMYYKSSIYEQIGDDLKLTQFENVDLRGYFPASLMNMIMSNYTIDSLTGFHEVLLEIKNE